MVESTPKSIGEYRCVQKLGAGGQATAWLAEAPDSRDEVLIKVLHVEAAENWKLVELFERSAVTLEAIEHPRIPAYRDHFELVEDDAVRLCLVRDFIAGQSLQDVIDDGGSFSEDQIIDIALQLLEILTYLHERDPPIVHRDLKPANVIISDSKVHLVDFGAVQAHVMRETGGSTVVGTAGYVAPEQLMGRAQPGSDIYALGVTLAHLIARKPPLEFETNGFELDIASEVHTSPELAYILGRMTRADLSEREDSARRLLKVFSDLRSGNEIVVRSSTLPTRPPAGSNLEVIDTGDSITISVPKTFRRFMAESSNSVDLFAFAMGSVFMVVFSYLVKLPAGIVVAALLLVLGFVWLFWRWKPARIELLPQRVVLTTSSTGGHCAHLDRASLPVGYLWANERSFPYRALQGIEFARTIHGARVMLLRSSPGFQIAPESLPTEQRYFDSELLGLNFSLSQGEDIWLASLLNARLAQEREIHGD